MTDTGAMVYGDPNPSVGPYDGSDDTLVGILNQSSAPVGSLPLSSTTLPIFGFESDGICSGFNPGPTGCPFGPTGYEGPGTSFGAISTDMMSGTVSFSPPIPPGGSAYFSLEDTLSATDITPGPPSPNPMGAPTVTGLSPSSGPEAGGTPVTITGTGFTGATAVGFGSAPATAFTVDSPTQITATAPPGSGTVDVTVTTPGGKSPTAPADLYAYIPRPTVTGLHPPSGPESGGTAVTITGTGFTGATAVDFGSATATVFTVDSPTQITAAAPPGSGVVDVTVAAAGGATATSSADRYTYVPPPPVVTGVAPASGVTTGGTGVVVFGSNLQGATGIAFGSKPGEVLGVNAAGTQLTALAPAGSGTVDVTVTTPAGTSPVSPADRYTYVTPPPGFTPPPPGPPPTGMPAGMPAGSGGSGNSGQRPPASPTGPPKLVGSPGTVSLTGAAKVISSSSVEFTATINPQGLPTTAHFEYSRPYGGATAAAITYPATTPEQSVGSDFANHTVTARVAGLLPNTTYHFRPVATNAAGKIAGADATFRSATDPPPPPPVLGKAVNATPISGTVFILLPGKGHVASAHASAAKGVGFIPLTEARQLPVGATFDTTGGVARLTSATATRGRTQSGDFGSGVFKVLQNRRLRGLTELALVARSGSGKACAAAAGKAQTAAKRALPKTVLNALRANAKGRFRTRGRYSSATVRGTDWTTTDRCDGTLTAVKRGVVVVSDFRRRLQIVVRAGRRYLARAT
ncbi:MAG: IPT/TIG domain-containing protein [Solirubrobacteraceae bacterium]